MDKISALSLLFLFLVPCTMTRALDEPLDLSSQRETATVPAFLPGTQLAKEQWDEPSNAVPCAPEYGCVNAATCDPYWAACVEARFFQGCWQQTCWNW